MSVVAWDEGPRGVARPSREWTSLMPSAIDLGKALADTEFVPKALRHNPAAILGCIMYGDEIGLGPMQSLSKIAMVDGRPTLFAEAQRALILAAGHEMWVEDPTNTHVTWAGRRANEDRIIRATWTLDDAKAAGLMGKDAWKKYPRAMLSARASAELARLNFADVIGGLAAAEEVDVGEVEPEAGGAPAPAPAGPGTRRRRRSPSSELGVGPPAIRPAPPVLVDEALPPLPHEPGYEEPAAPIPVEATPTENPDAPPPITDDQLKMLQTSMREAGITGRVERLEFCTEVTGRQIASSRQLTKTEASAVIDAIKIKLAWREQQESQPPEAASAHPDDAAASSTPVAGAHDPEEVPPEGG